MAHPSKYTPGPEQLDPTRDAINKGVKASGSAQQQLQQLCY